jgi:hypothetical protein
MEFKRSVNCEEAEVDGIAKLYHAMLMKQSIEIT